MVALVRIDSLKLKCLIYALLVILNAQIMCVSCNESINKIVFVFTQVACTLSPSATGSTNTVVLVKLTFSF